VVLLTIWQGRRVKRQLAEAEARQGKNNG
jgi:hypothetical protein